MPIDTSATMKGRASASRIIAARKKVLDAAQAECKRVGKPFLRNDPALLAAIDLGVYTECWEVEDTNTNHREAGRRSHLCGKGPALKSPNGIRL
jgi:hypothetical protein